MNVEAVIKKAESDEGLTVKEIKVYQKAVKPVKHVYGKYGTLAKRYLEDKGLDYRCVDLCNHFAGVSVDGKSCNL